MTVLKMVHIVCNKQNVPCSCPLGMYHAMNIIHVHDFFSCHECIHVHVIHAMEIFMSMNNILNLNNLNNNYFTSVFY